MKVQNGFTAFTPKSIHFNLPAKTCLHRAYQCKHGLPICGQFIELTWVAIAESERFATKTS
jgi:hypothetical protein